jgi:hypothetical protein
MPDVELLTLLKVVVAPLLLAAALVYGIVKYRQRGPATKKLTEEATRDLYREGAREERQQESPPLSPSPPDTRPVSRTQRTTEEKPWP